MSSSSSSSLLPELKAQAVAMLKSQLGDNNGPLLAAAVAQLEEQIASDPESFLLQMDNSPAGKIRQCRLRRRQQQQQQQHSKGVDHHDAIVARVLNDQIRSFLKKSNTDKQTTKRTYPAVDLAAGSAYSTSQWALAYRETLEWYPTDNATEQFTLPCLKYLISEQAHLEEDDEASTKEPLCRDRNGSSVFAHQRIVLHGLQKEVYNGQEGVALAKDAKVPGRYAILLDSHDKPKSFKANNIVLVATARETNNNGSAMGTTTSSTTSRNSEDAATVTIYNGLLERTCHVDVLDKDTWHTLLSKKKLAGQCAVVTCTNLLTEIGHREPTAWMQVMEIAAALLQPGGFLLHGDADGWDGQFGNLDVMEDYANHLGLTLLPHYVENGSTADDSKVRVTRTKNAWALVVWEKL